MAAGSAERKKDYGLSKLIISSMQKIYISLNKEGIINRSHGYAVTYHSYVIDSGATHESTEAIQKEEKWQHCNFLLRLLRCSELKFLPHRDHKLSKIGLQIFRRKSSTNAIIISLTRQNFLSTTMELKFQATIRFNIMYTNLFVVLFRFDCSTFKVAPTHKMIRKSLQVLPYKYEIL